MIMREEGTRKERQITVYLLNMQGKKKASVLPLPRFFHHSQFSTCPNQVLTRSDGKTFTN